MTYVDRAAIAADPVFGNRVRVALMTAAIGSALTPQGPNESDFYYKHRIHFAIDMIYTNPGQYLTAAIWALVWNSQGASGTVDIVAAAADLTDTGDAEIQVAVNMIFAFMATVL
jgi:hypothetical protein